MSVTTPTNVDTSIPESWAKGVLRKHARAGFWGRFASGSPGSVIVQKSELLNKPGDLIHIQVTDVLSGAGVSGDTTALEGSEENLTTSEIKCSPLLYRHGVRSYRRAAKKSILNLREETQMRLAEWGMSKMDSVRFSNFTASALPSPLNGETYTPNVYGIGTGTGATKADIEVGNVASIASARYIRYTLQDQKAKPVVINGLPWYFWVITPEMEVSLKGDSTYKDYVLSAASRGMDNPVFTGAIANVEGIVILPHASVLTGADAGAGTDVPYAKSIAFGAEAFVEALDEDVTWVEKTFDYDNELGVAYSFAFQPRRALEQSSLQVLASNPAPAG